MHTAAARFLQYLRVERNASDLTIKSYREDLMALAAYLAEANGGRAVEPGALTALDLRGYVDGVARGGLRESDDRAATGLAAEFLSFRATRRLGKDEPGQAAAQPAPGPHAAALPYRRGDRAIAPGPARRAADGTPRPRPAGDDVFGRAAGERGGRLAAGGPRSGSRRAPRPRQGAAGAVGPNRLLCVAGVAPLAGRAAASSAAAAGARVAACSSTSSAAA